MAHHRVLLVSLPLLLLACKPTSSGRGAVASAVTTTTTGKPPSLTDEMPSATGRFQTFSTKGTIDTTNAFFAAIGTNGRTCASCHRAQDGWTITPGDVQAIFNATTPKGIDPLFRSNDGAVSPRADVSTESARAIAYAMLLNKGLIRVGIGIPAGAEFGLLTVDDPYGYASASELSLFRRPLPSSNLPFLSTVMWDGRETFPGQKLNADLMHQANDATNGHAQATALLDLSTLAAIADLEMSLYVAATYDNDAGSLTAQQATGDPTDLASVPFHLGINDVLGGDPTANPAPFTPNVFTVYNAWQGAIGKTNGQDAARGAVARGQALFNTRPFTISGVKGLNDLAAVGPSLQGSCSTCHDTPNVGNHSMPLPIDIGISDASRRTPDMPLYTLVNLTTRESIQTTDPGRALITGRWADIGKFKGPVLRALSSRPPYFHNGSAATLADVVNFYDTRFGIGFSAQEKSDLVAFLRTL